MPSAGWRSEISRSPTFAQLSNPGRWIENYPEDQPHPSKLVLGHVAGRPLHVVAAEDPESGRTVIVTVYEPDAAQWDPAFRRRLDR